MSPIKILVANPNSSKSITDTLEKTITPPPGCQLGFFTGPPPAPPSINDTETSLQSERVCLPVLTSVGNDWDAILVACYSEHPLVKSLRGALPGKPVIGIMEASITHAMLLGRKFGIVTTGQAWEDLLTQGVANFLGTEIPTTVPTASWRNKRFSGVASTGLGVLELHEADAAEVSRRIGEAARALVEHGEAEVICLGCAGMTGLEEAVLKGVGDRNVVVVDGVQAGVELLAGLARRNIRGS